VRESTRERLLATHGNQRVMVSEIPYADKVDISWNHFNRDHNL
jgi:hypothetical protein